MTTKENQPKASHIPRMKTVTLLVVSLGLIFIFSAALIAVWTASITSSQGNTAARQFAHVVSDLAQACGEGASMEGLKLFLRNMEQHEFLEEIHVIRTPVTVKDFDEREDAALPDEVEKQILRDGQPKELVDKEAHKIRYVSPTIADESCVRRCHESARAGDILGIASITIRTDETDAARSKLNTIMIALFVAAGIIEVIFIIILLSKENAEKDRIRTEKANQQLKTYVRKVSDLAEEAQQANHTKSEFLANMSHEIRTPMNAILGFTDILAQEELTKEQTDYVLTIRNSGEHLLRLINDILDFSKIEAGKLEIEYMDCSLEKIMGNLDSIMHTRALEKGLEFKILHRTELPACIRTDPTRLYQCLVNLASNALKFTETGHIHVVVSQERTENTPMILFQVEDTGIGIPPDKQKVIFDSFSQADGSTTRKFGGTGLGLAITKKLVEMLGGTISMESEPGKGSTFSLRIPTGLTKDAGLSLGEEKLKQYTQESAASIPPSFSGRVLVAEDNPANQRLIHLLLQKMGVQITLVDDGKQAVDMALTENFDIILMDMQMPVMNGYDATGILRQKEVTTPIIALTANAMTGDEQKCLACGCDAYLVKPVDRKKLHDVMGKYLSPAESHTEHSHQESPISSDSETRTSSSMTSQSHENGMEIRTNVIDWNALIGICDEEEVVTEIITAFSDDTPKCMEKIMTALRLRDAEELRIYAHRIKGASASIGAKPVADITARLEQAGKECDWTTAQALIDQVQNEVDRLLAFISEPDWMDKAKQEVIPDEQSNA